MYTTMKLHSFIITLLCAVFFASCNKEDSYHTFSFDANGECYMPDVANISMEEFKSSVVGYGWKHVITHEIECDGKCTTKDYYEDLIGGGPTVSDRFRHFAFSLFSTDEEMEPERTDIYDLSYNEVVFNKNMEFREPSENRSLSYEYSSIETTVREGFAGSIISHYNCSYMLVVDTDKKARLILLQNGRLYLKEFLPKETLQTII